MSKITKCSRWSYDGRLVCARFKHVFPSLKISTLGLCPCVDISTSGHHIWMSPLQAWITCIMRMMMTYMIFVYLTDNHSEGEHIHLLIICQSEDHLRRHPVRIADDRFALVPSKQSTSAGQSLTVAVHKWSIPDNNRACEAKVCHDHRVILARQNARNTAKARWSGWITDPCSTQHALDSLTTMAFVTTQSVQMDVIVSMLHYVAPCR